MNYVHIIPSMGGSIIGASIIFFSISSLAFFSSSAFLIAAAPAQHAQQQQQRMMATMINTTMSTVIKIVEVWSESYELKLQTLFLAELTYAKF